MFSCSWSFFFLLDVCACVCAPPPSLLRFFGIVVFFLFRRYRAGTSALGEGKYDGAEMEISAPSYYANTSLAILYHTV